MEDSGIPLAAIRQALCPPVSQELRLLMVPGTSMEGAGTGFQPAAIRQAHCHPTSQVLALAKQAYGSILIREFGFGVQPAAIRQAHCHP